MASFDLGQLGRLDDEYDKQLQQCLQTKKHYEKMNADYEALSVRLSTLTDKVSHEIMVPFGSLAFMPGKIVHTNEITVHLGGGWFVERSAKQALEIVKRRMIMYSNMLKKLEKEEEHILKWIKYSKDVKVDENLVEIQEEYDPEKEEMWRKEHQENVRRYKQSMKDKPKEDVHEDLIKKLDELAQGDENDITSEIPNNVSIVETQPTSINFTHSSNDKTILETNSETQFPIIQSPDDIYKYFGCTKSQETTKSILKRRNYKNETESKSQKNHVRFADEEMAKPEREYTLAEPMKPVAFSGIVMEKTLSENLVEVKEENQTKKPVSKFKAQRQTVQTQHVNAKTEIIEDESNLINLEPSNSLDEKTESKPTENEHKPKTAFSTILERSGIEPMKPSDFKDSSKRPVSKFKAQRQGQKK